MTDELDPISPEKARKLLDDAIVARLGENWDDELTGWTLVTGHDYMARLVKGGRTIDFQVDLLGNLNIEEKDSGLEASYGRLLAWLILSGSLFLAFIIARIAGYL